LGLRRFQRPKHPSVDAEDCFEEFGAVIGLDEANGLGWPTVGEDREGAVMQLYDGHPTRSADRLLIVVGKALEGD
jgi:hypothetical protein